MKLDNFIILLKGWAITTGAGASTIAAGLSQLPASITKLFGLPIPVLSLLLNAYAVMMVACLGFISSSFGDFMTKRNGNGTGFFPNPNPPKPPGT